MYFHRRGNLNEPEQHPWIPRSNWNPPHNMNEKLYEYLEEVPNDFFQYKGARLFIEWKEIYGSKVEAYLEDAKIFRQEDHDMSQMRQIVGVFFW